MAPSIPVAEGHEASQTPVPYVLALLALVSFFNYMDRMVLAVLLEPIKHDLKLSDSQLGLLSGLAFAALYATVGLPLARVADKASRVRLLTTCLTLWSVMTALTGLARNFPQIFIARMGVGIGEAGCVPAAHSLIGDYLPPQRRALGVSVFQAGGLAGVSGGLALAGFLADSLGWRAALWIVGLSGLPLAMLILFTMREPPRAAHGVISSEPGWRAVQALLRRRSLRHLVLALSIGGFATYGLGQWIPAFFVRSHGLSLTQVGLWSGLTSGAGGIIGVLLGGWFAVRLIRRDERWELWFPAAGYAASIPFYLLTFLASSPWMALTAKFFAVFVASSAGGVALSALQSFAEPSRRATSVALVLFLSSFIGLGLGPLVIGVASEALAPTLGVSSLRYSLLFASCVFGWSAIHFLIAALSSNHDRVRSEA